MKWPLKRLADLGAVSTGSTPSTAEPRFYGGEFPFVTPAELDTGLPVTTTTRSLTEEGAAEARLLPEGAVMVCCIGSLGKIGIAGRSVATNQQINSVVFDRQKVWPKYGFYACRLLKPKMECMAPATTLPIVSKSKFAELEIPLPPLAEQRRIAEVLDRAEALRAKRRAALAELDSLTQSLFLDLFGDPASLSLQHPVSPLESILYRPLQNGAYYPKEAYSEDGVEMVHMSDAFYEVVPRGGLKRVICPQSDVEKYSLTEADILIARRSLTLEGAAKPCLIPPSSEALIFESSFIRVTPDPAKVSALYLYHYLGNERVKQKCVQPFITQSTISGINQSNLERVPVVVPPIALQQEFARRVGAVEKLKQAQRAALAEQDALFATLQHRAFRGEL